MPFALVVVDRRVVRLILRIPDDHTKVDTISVGRMAHENSALWTRASLVEALRTEHPTIEYVGSDHPDKPSEALDASPVYTFPGIDGKGVLLKPDEETIYIGNHVERCNS